MEPKHPEIEVELTNRDGNALAIVARVRSAMKRGGVSLAEREKFTAECFDSGSYDELLQTAMRWVSVS